MQANVSFLTELVEQMTGFDSFADMEIKIALLTAQPIDMTVVNARVKIVCGSFKSQWNIENILRKSDKHIHFTLQINMTIKRRSENANFRINKFLNSLRC